jgi:hypothetical protein
MLPEIKRMAANSKRLYDDSIWTLPAKQRLQLAAMILDDLANAAKFDDAWTEEDMRDLAAFSLSLAPAHDSNNEAS